MYYIYAQYIHEVSIYIYTYIHTHTHAHRKAKLSVKAVLYLYIHPTDMTGLIRSQKDEEAQIPKQRRSEHLGGV